MPSYIYFTPHEPFLLKLHHYRTEFKLLNKIMPNCDIDGEDVSNFELNKELMLRLTSYSEYSHPGNW